MLANYAFVWQLGFEVDIGTLPSVYQKFNVFGPTFCLGFRVTTCSACCRDLRELH